jgi:hypothetical protein
VKTIKLTKKEFDELQKILWVQSNQCESCQDEDSEDFDLEYTKIMHSIYKKFDLSYNPKFIKREVLDE